MTAGGFHLFRAYRGIGLHIGSNKIRIAVLKIKKNRLHLMDYGSVLVPSGAVDAGNIVDPEQLGLALRELVQELGLTGQKVVSAVSGPQVYTRNIVLPRMKPRDLKEASVFFASTFLPIPVEEAVIDVYPLRNTEDEEGPKIEVFFVAARRIQVEMLDIVCETAGLELVAVEIGPLALCRALCNEQEDTCIAYLYLGVSRVYFTVFQAGMLLYFRYLALASSSDYQQLGIDPSYPQQESSRSLIPYQAQDIKAELSRSIEYFELQNRDRKIGQIMLCGPGSGSPGLIEGFSDNIERQINRAEDINNIVLPEKLTPPQRSELLMDYLVAIGLAARDTGTRKFRI